MTFSLSSLDGLRPNPDWAKLPILDRKGWKRVRFGDVVENLNETERNPAEAGLERFIGLEHLEPRFLHIRAWGKVVDGTTFTRRCRPGQVLFGKRRAYQRKVVVAEFDAVVSGDIYVLVPKNDRLLLELLPFLCMSERFFQHAVGTSAGSLSPRTNWTSLASFEFDLPSLDQQKRIAEILWVVDEANSKAESLLENVTKTRQALAASLLDAEAFSNWQAQSLKNCMEIGSGQIDPKEEPYSSMCLVAPNYIEQASGRLISRETAAQQNAISGKFLFQRGDILYSKIRPNLRKCIMTDFDGICSSDMYVLTPLATMLRARFLLAILLSDKFTSYAILNSKGTAFPRISRGAFQSFSIPVPPFIIQDRICEQLSELDALFSAANENRRKRQRMLSALLTALFGGQP